VAPLITPESSNWMAVAATRIARSRQPQSFHRLSATFRVRSRPVPLTTNTYIATTDTTNVTYNWFLTNNTAGAFIVGAATNPVVQIGNGATGALR